MEPFIQIVSIVAPIDQINVDTDQIIPARFLGKPREQQSDGLFYDIRRDAEGQLRSGFPLNNPVYRGAKILIARENFGCGSSREQAVTVLVDNGFRAVIAPSYSDIFYSNCFQNGVLPIRLPSARVNAILESALREPSGELSIDLRRQVVTTTSQFSDRFEIDSFRKECLLQGMDDVSLTRSYEEQIAAFERTQDLRMPWLRLHKESEL